MAEKRNLVIHFMDGTKVVYDFPKPDADKNSVSSRIEKILSMQYVVLEGDGAMQLYPVANIKSIQLYPLPDVIPEFVIRGAESVDVF